LFRRVICAESLLSTKYFAFHAYEFYSPASD
jgi:hypothetical protein